MVYYLCLVHRLHEEYLIKITFFKRWNPQIMHYNNTTVQPFPRNGEPEVNYGDKFGMERDTCRSD